MYRRPRLLPRRTVRLEAIEDPALAECQAKAVAIEEDARNAFPIGILELDLFPMDAAIGRFS